MGQPELRTPAKAEGQALIIATHTESTGIVTALLRDMGMALAWEGFDVDAIPYGQAFTAADLSSASLVILPPTVDYPGQHLEVWREAELALLEGYVAQGGLLVVVNSGCNRITTGCIDDVNEDARALNPLLEPMGVRFMFGAGLDDAIALAKAEHPLTENATYLTFERGEGVPFRMQKGLTLVSAAARPLVGLVSYGENGGEVLVIGEIGVLQTGGGGKNLEFMRNIGRYAKER